jgi:hypothetical protein
MKYLKYTLIILVFFTCSCEKKMLITRADVPLGIMVTIDIDNDVIDAADIPGTPFTCTFNAPGLNVSKHDIYARRIYNAAADTTDYILVDAVTSFPSDWSVDGVALATAFGVPLDDAYGDRYEFECEATDKSGSTASYENLDSDIVGSTGQMQGFRFSYAYVCPSDPSLIVGTYTSLASGSFPDFGEYTDIPSEVTIIETDEEGFYELSDFSFGTYDVYYGPYYTEKLDCTGTIQDACGIYFIVDTDDYWGETVYGDVKLNANGTITVVGGTSYGEEWTATLTKK